MENIYDMTFQEGDNLFILLIKALTWGTWEEKVNQEMKKVRYKEKMLSITVETNDNF